uniref:Metalloendopeptidase n=1 Tax=Plectus sambesii TaxID=2011161 RepID=A0A914V707_9BILA
MMMLTGFVALALVAVVVESRGVVPSTGASKNAKTNTAKVQDKTGLTAEDFENAKKLTPAQKYGTGEEKGMENSNLFEGDIANPGLNSSTIYRFMGQINPNDQGGNMRNAIKATYYRWPANTIPYTIASTFTEPERAIIADALSDMMNKTCYKFVGRTNQTDYVNMVKGNGCSSYIGKVGKQQNFTLGNGCIYRHIIQHEMIHAMGLFHEQSRADRDQYVEVLSQNVEDGKLHNFNKYDLNKIDHLGQPYDYYSIMHYQGTAFARSGTVSIRPVASAVGMGIKLERRREMSPIDIKKLNIMAGCPNFVAASG